MFCAIRPVSLTLSLVLSSASVAHAQQVVLDTSSEPPGKTYQVKWQPDLRRMIAYRDASDANVPAIRVSAATGGNLSIYPLKDFPGSTYAEVWDTTGAPNGDLIVAAVVAYGPLDTKPPVKSLLLTYSENGTLIKVWDVGPYHHHRVAVDEAGDVFALGDMVSGAGDYPLLVKYSSSGRVLGESLSSALFAGKDSVVDLSSPNGEPELFIKSGIAHVWIPATLQLFAFSLDGAQVSATSLAAGVQTLADLSGGSQVRFLALDVSSNAAIICQVRLRPKATAAAASVATARLKPDGSFESWLEPISTGDLHRFVGLTSGDETVFLEKTSKTAVKIDLNE